jgi:hypothetical protein
MVVVSRFPVLPRRLAPSGAVAIPRCAPQTVRSPNDIVQSRVLDHHLNGVVSVGRRGIVPGA